MKKRMSERKKKIAALLRQKDGATIVFALVVFMIAAIASATIVSVAMANLTRTAGRRTYEQARLAVMSAAKYLESDEAGLKTALNALPTGATGPTWTVSVSDADADAALQAQIKWEDIENRSSMTAVISSGGAGGSEGYAAQVRLVFDAGSGKWHISKFVKKSGS